MSAAAAFPFFQPSAIELGVVSLQPFGILVATGVLLGAWTARLRAVQLGIEEDKVRTMALYLLVCGFLGAHLFDVLFYQAHKLGSDPLLLVKVWQGISSYGGFIGGVVGFILFVNRHRIKDVLAYADIMFWGALPGFTVGRMGCTSVHDHPGSKLAEGTDFFLAIDYPEWAVEGRSELVNTGGAGLRHDLGLYELVFLLCLVGFIVLVTWAGRKQKVGFIVAVTASAYGVVRFFLDYLRLGAYSDSAGNVIKGPDPRYLGLTFAQYLSVAFLLGGLATFVWMMRSPKWTGPTASEPPPEKKTGGGVGVKARGKGRGPARKKVSSGGAAGGKSGGRAADDGGDASKPGRKKK